MDGHFIDLGIFETEAEALYEKYKAQLEGWFIGQTKPPRHVDAFAKRYWEEKTRGLLTRESRS